MAASWARNGRTPRRRARAGATARRPPRHTPARAAPPATRPPALTPTLDESPARSSCLRPHRFRVACPGDSPTRRAWPEPRLATRAWPRAAALAWATPDEGGEGESQPQPRSAAEWQQQLGDLPWWRLRQRRRRPPQPRSLQAKELWRRPWPAGAPHLMCLHAEEKCAPAGKTRGTTTGGGWAVRWTGNQRPPARSKRRWGKRKKLKLPRALKGTKCSAAATPPTTTATIGYHHC